MHYLAGQWQQIYANHISITHTANGYIFVAIATNGELKHIHGIQNNKNYKLQSLTITPNMTINNHNG